MTEGLTYNTQREHVVIPAYGRIVQDLLAKALTLEGERQQALVERIVRMMVQKVGQQEDMTREDVERKLWRHAYRMTGYRLTAVPPDGEAPTPSEDQVVPDEVPYPKAVMKQRNYGGYVQKLIERAAATEDPERRRAVVKTIGSYMKLAYSTYNDAQNISDRVILGDLRKMSEGKFEVPDELDLDAFMGKGTQSHIKQTAPTSRRRSGQKRNKKNNRNRRRFRKR